MVKKLRIARLLLAVAFLIATLLYFLLGESHAPSVVVQSRRLQIAPLYLAESAGIFAVWLLITLVWGRVYCSTICPVGTLQDLMLAVRRRIPALNKPFRFRTSRRVRIHILIIYLICLAAGLVAVPLIIEPWFMTGNMTRLFGATYPADLWVRYGFSAFWGMVCGILSLAVVLPWALLQGREFCNTICPLGTAMGLLSRYSAFRMVIDGDKCNSCMLCQDNCRASAIKVISRHIDNTRCVRCLQCISDCPQRAIRYTQDRQRPATPLFRRARRADSV